MHQAAAKAYSDPDLRLPSKQAFHSLFCIMATLRLLSRLGRGRQAFALLLLLKTSIIASSGMILKKIDIIYPSFPGERDRSEISPVFRLFALLPSDRSFQNCGKRHIWVGKAERSDEHLLAIEGTTFSARAIRRKPKEEQWDLDSVKKIVTKRGL